VFIGKCLPLGQTDEFSKAVVATSSCKTDELLCVCSWEKDLPVGIFEFTGYLCPITVKLHGKREPF
jgi:hypothetical protein